MTHPMFNDESETELAPRGAEGELAAFRLTVIEGGDRSKALVVDGAATPPVIGKSPNCELVLADSMVSRRHAQLDVVDGQQLRLTDLGSKNGTYVNGVRVAEAFLKGGETITIGHTKLRVDRVQSEANPLGTANGFGRVLGASAVMRRLHPMLERFASSDIPVVIQGETGTGKELLAETLHELGPRKNGPFVVLDCSSVVPADVEATLFGDERKGSRGVFEQADKGTLLIDEITELPMDLQRKLLRALEKGEFQRVGSDKPSKVDVRVIATTRADLEKEVENGRFREDVFFRLAVGRVELPPLRRRQGDTAMLADHFARVAGSTLPSDFLRRYEGYSWPGNVRELQNAVTRRLALGDADVEASDHTTEREGAPDGAFRWALEQNLPFTSARDLVTREFERAYVTRVLEEHNGNVSRAAIASGLARRYFQILRARQR